MVQKIRTASLVMFLALLVGTPLAPAFDYVTDAPPTYAQAEPEPSPSPQQPPQDVTTPETNNSPSSSTAQAEQNEADNEIDFAGNCRQSIGVLSWIICPVLNLANDLSSNFANYIIELLSVEPLLVGSDDARNQFLYSAWSQFRNLANIALVFIFIILIYMQLTGSQTYMVQRTLPRFVIAAVLMQFSYFFGAFIIDIGNVLAAGIAGIFNEINSEILQQSPGAVDLLDNGTLSASLPQEVIGQEPGQIGLGDSLGGGLMGGAGAVVGFSLLIFLAIAFAVTSFFPPLGVVIMFGLIGLLIAFLALVLRQLGIVMFIVLSPFAFLFMALPGTEKMFREWVDNLSKLVLIYPLAVLLFSISSTMSLLALGTGQSEMNQIIAAAIPILVLFLIPTLFRLAGSVFRGGVAFITGKGKQLGQSAAGDYRDPGSFKFKSRQSALTKRAARARKLQDNPTTRTMFPMAKSERLEAEMYKMGGQSLEGVLSDKFPGKLKRIFWGDTPFNSMLGVEPYEVKDVNDTNWFSRSARYIRENRSEVATAAGVMAGYIGQHFDRGMNTFHALGSMPKRGEMSKDMAEEAFGVIQGYTKSGQRHLGVYDFDKDIMSDYNTSPQALYDYAFGDYTRLDEAGAQRNLQLKKKFVGIGSGTMQQQQGEGPFKAMADTLKDDRLTAEAQTDQKLYGNLEALVLEAESMNANVRASGQTTDQLARRAQEGEEIPVAGFYGKSGNEIRAMREFMQSALEVRDKLGIDTGMRSAKQDPDQIRPD